LRPRRPGLRAVRAQTLRGSADAPGRPLRDDSLMVGRQGLSGRRVLVAAVAAAATLAAASAAGAPWSVALLLAWEAGATVYLVWIWMTISGFDGAETKRLAASED